MILKNYHEISEDLEGSKFAGIGLSWYYTKQHSGRTFRLSMKNYIAKLLLKVGHQPPGKNRFPRTVVVRSRMALRFNKHQKRIHILPYIK